MSLKYTTGIVKSNSMKLNVDILTIFPGMFAGPFAESILSRAQRAGLVKIKIHDLRDWAEDKRKTIDDKPFGGGAGMVMRVDIIDKALAALNPGYKILLTPQGKSFNQKLAAKLSRKKHLILVCGHYEGFDERIRALVDEEISIGDYVLTGGELPAMIVTDTIVRLLPGVVGNKASTADESFSAGLLEYPQYTRPAEYKGKKVPEVLLSGDHAAVNKWRTDQAKKRTKLRRPDLSKS